MGERENVARRLLRDTKVVNVDVLNDSFLIVTFSNGAAAKVSLEDVKELALSSAIEIVYAEGEDLHRGENGH